MGAQDSGRLLDLLQTAEWLREDLEYHPEFMALMSAAAPRAEQQFGTVIIPPPPVDWPDIYGRTVDLFSRALDLRLAVLFVRASLRVHGWVELAPALNVVRAIVERHWDGVYPLPDDDGDDVMRVNALSALADRQTTLADLREATARGGIGPTVREILQAWDTVSDSPTESRSVDKICADLRRMETSPVVIEALRAANDAAVELDGVIGSRVSAPPDLAALLQITRGLADVSAIACAGADRPPSPLDEGRQDAVTPSGREGALTELRSVAEWFDAEGLTDRVPAMMRQARRLQMQTFAKVLADVVPNAGDPLEPAGEPPAES
jgi:type VI secretion system protein ImpA